MYVGMVRISMLYERVSGAASGLIMSLESSLESYLSELYLAIVLLSQDTHYFLLSDSDHCISGMG